jgi:plasmid stability protein
MPSLVINDLPTELHTKLTQEAARQQCSVEQQVIQLLEQCLTKVTAKPLGARRPKELPEPVELSVKMDSDWIYNAIQEGRK